MWLLQRRIPKPNSMPRPYSSAHPKSERTNWRKLSHPALMLLHRLHRDNPPQKKNKKTGCKVQPPHSSSYFIARTHLHNCVASSWNHHNHFPYKTLLKLPIFRIPKPPVPMAKQTVSHATKENLNFSSEAPHKKLLIISLTPFITLVGIVNIER